MTAITSAMLDRRAQFILQHFGAPSDWSDVQAIALCPIAFARDAWGISTYLLWQGKHATNRIEALGCAIRLMHVER